MDTNIKNVDPRSIERELLEIYKRAYEEWQEYAYHSDRRILDYFKWLKKRAPEGFLVAFADEKPIGFVAVDYRWVDYNGEAVGEIHELAVDPNFQDRDIGKQLLLAGLDLLREKGRRKFSLWVGGNNIKAQTLYRKLGFREEDGWSTWVRMIKEDRD